MKRWLSKIIKGENGQALPIVLVVMVLGGLMIVPSLNFHWTSLKTTQIHNEHVKGLYAADAGIEDALWRIKNDAPTSFPYTFQITGRNGMSVDVTIEEVTTIAGEEIGDSGVHEEWLVTDTSATYNTETGIYDYTLSLTNDGSGNMKIIKVLIILPPQLEYVEGSTSGDFATADPTVVGDSNTGITLIWDMSVEGIPTIKVGETSEHCFQLSGPPDVEGVEGKGIVEAQRDDVGTVWINETHPYTITAQAKDSAGKVVSTIRAGVWQGTELEISCWQVK